MFHREAVPMTDNIFQRITVVKLQMASSIETPVSPKEILRNSVEL